MISGQGKAGEGDKCGIQVSINLKAFCAVHMFEEYRNF
jgi:hypothetical protein